MDSKKKLMEIAQKAAYSSLPRLNQISLHNKKCGKRYSVYGKDVRLTTAHR